MPWVPLIKGKYKESGFTKKSHSSNTRMAPQIWCYIYLKISNGKINVM